MEQVLEWTEPDVTRRAGIALGLVARPGHAIGLVGDLGAGKTLLVQGIAEGLAVPPRVRITSPTFTLVNEYPGGRVPLYHADLYRIERARELDELGLDDLLRRADGVVCIEWSDRFPVLPRDNLTLHLEVLGDHERRVIARAGGVESAALLGAWLGDS